MSLTITATFSPSRLTGQDVEVSKSGTRLVGPSIVSSEIIGQEQHVGVMFNNMDEANAWLKEQRAKGVDIRFDPSKAEQVRTGVLHKTLQFGGTEDHASRAQVATFRRYEYQLDRLDIAAPRNPSIC